MSFRMPVSVSDFDELADMELSILEDKIDTLDVDAPIEQYFVDGVMKITVEYGVYVINKNAENQQIWVSSPISGPSRFGNNKGIWSNEDGKCIDELVLSELREHLGKDE